MKQENSTPKIVTIIATLRGIRPIMFDRYAGDNKTTLPPMDKGYTNEAGEFGIPALNVYSLLAAQNTPSVAKRFYGKSGREIALGVQAHVNIEAVEGGDPLFAPIKYDDGKTIKKDDNRVRIVEHVARLKDGIPNPKKRPMLPTGWIVKFKFEHEENQMCTLAGLENMIKQGGILGLGTFRPIFGRYSAHIVHIGE